MTELERSSNTEPTMSSKEIAELTGKRHPNVIRDIREMRGQLGDDSNLIHLEEVEDSRGYTAEFLLNRYLTEVLITGYDTRRRAAVIKRWYDLESGVASPAHSQDIPATYSQALRLAADKVEQIQALTEEIEAKREWIEELKPAVEFAKTVKNSEDAISVGEAAKILGTGRQRLFTVLRKRQWITRHNEPYQKAITSGLMDVKLGHFRHPEQGLKQAVTPLITGKGLAKLQSIWLEDVSAEREGEK